MGGRGQFKQVGAVVLLIWLKGPASVCDDLLASVVVYLGEDRSHSPWVGGVARGGVRCENKIWPSFRPHVIKG